VTTSTVTADAVDVPLSTYTAVLRRNGWLIAAMMAIGAVIGLFVAARSTTYVADTIVLVPDARLDPQLYQDNSTSATALGADTEAAIATSTPVVDAARSAAGPHSDGSLVISAPPNTTALELSFTGPTPARARAGADAAAAAYIAQRSDLLGDAQEQALSTFDAQASALTAKLPQARAAERVGTTTQRAAATAYANALVARIRAARSEQLDLESGPPDEASVLRPATDEPVRRHVGRAIPVTSGIVLGGLAALVIGAGRPRTVDRSAEVEFDDGLSTGVIARVTKTRRGAGRVVDGKGIRRLRNHVVADGGGLTLICGPASAETVRAVGRLLAGRLSVVGAATTFVELPGTVPAGQAGRAAVVELRRNHRHVIVVAPDTDADACTIARIADRVLLCVEQGVDPMRDLVDVRGRLQLVGARCSGTVFVARSVR
jgi:hypothetical protein